MNNQTRNNAKEHQTFSVLPLVYLLYFTTTKMTNNLVLFDDMVLGNCISRISLIIHIVDAEGQQKLEVSRLVAFFYFKTIDFICHLTYFKQRLCYVLLLIYVTKNRNTSTYNKFIANYACSKHRM